MESLATKRARRRKRRGRGRPPGSQLDRREAEIRELLTLGVPLNRIAERMGCSESLMYQWIKKARRRWALEQPNFGLVKQR